MGEILLQIGGLGPMELGIILLILLLLGATVVAIATLFGRATGGPTGAEDEELRERVEELESKLEDMDGE